MRVDEPSGQITARNGPAHGIDTPDLSNAGSCRRVAHNTSDQPSLAVHGQPPRADQSTLANRTYADARFALAANCSPGMSASLAIGHPGFVSTADTLAATTGAGAAALPASQVGNEVRLPHGRCAALVPRRARLVR